MTIKVIQWNISYMKPILPKIDFLSRKLQEGGESCIFVLEEVKRGDVREIQKNMNDFQFIYSLDLREPGNNESKNRGLGILIGFSSKLKLLKYSIIERSLFPERTLCGQFLLDNIKISVLGFHSLTGVDYKKAKSAQFASIADFLEKEECGVDFLCFDANEPKEDYYNVSRTEFFDQKGDNGQSAGLILGQNKIHDLADSYKQYLSNKKSNIDTEGSPLATSYIVKGGNEKRYDYIFSSPRWDVQKVEYLYNEATEAGSDHALVSGLFEC